MAGPKVSLFRGSTVVNNEVGINFTCDRLPSTFVKDDLESEVFL